MDTSYELGFLGFGLSEPPKGQAVHQTSKHLIVVLNAVAGDARVRAGTTANRCHALGLVLGLLPCTFSLQVQGMRRCWTGFSREHLEMLQAGVRWGSRRHTKNAVLVLILACVLFGLCTCHPIFEALEEPQQTSKNRINFFNAAAGDARAKAGTTTNQSHALGLVMGLLPSNLKACVLEKEAGAFHVRNSRSICENLLM